MMKRELENAPVLVLKELTVYTQKQFMELGVLMKQLSDRVTLTEESLKAVVDDPNCRLYVLCDGEERIVGCATLCVFHSPTGRKASVEDVVVSEDLRGWHLGRRLMEHLLAEARTLAPIELHLTSKPTRVAANALYQSLGFVRKETNAYTLRLFM
ncbi:acetyltransferase, GNAT family [gut metagenome]|uniref:Acetyltransferase, GNAT family n=1 Tax=gut metagenome TaxID=749906 RepID=J9BZT4_9ZZZZ